MESKGGEGARLQQLRVTQQQRVADVSIEEREVSLHTIQQQRLEAETMKSTKVQNPQCSEGIPTSTLF